MLNVASTLKEACTKNCSTLLLHAWYLHGSHVTRDYQLCGMRAKTEVCSHSDTKVYPTRFGHFSSQPLIGLCIYVFLRAAKTSRTNAFNRLGANTDLDSFLSSKFLVWLSCLFHLWILYSRGRAQWTRDSAHGTYKLFTDSNFACTGNIVNEAVSQF